jgi:hypothetical protein
MPYISGATGWTTPYPVDLRGNVPRVKRRRNYRFSRANEASLPTATSCAANATGDTVVVTFSQNVGVGSTSPRDTSTDGVRITINGALASVASVTPATTTLTFTLDQTITASDIVHISYDGSGSIQAASADPVEYAPYFWFTETAA